MEMPDVFVKEENLAGPVSAVTCFHAVDTAMNNLNGAAVALTNPDGAEVETCQKVFGDYQALVGEFMDTHKPRTVTVMDVAVLTVKALKPVLARLERFIDNADPDDETVED